MVSELKLIFIIFIIGGFVSWYLNEDIMFVLKFFTSPTVGLVLVVNRFMNAQM